MVGAEPVDTAQGEPETPGPFRLAALWRGRSIPGWVVATALASLLLAVGLAGFWVRGLIVDHSRRSAIEDSRIARWESEVAAHPDDVQARLQLGYAYQQAGRYDRAIEAYDRVLAEDPKNTAALYNRAVMYTKLDLGGQAEVAYWDVLEVEPDHAQAAQALGEYYASRGHYRSLLRAVRPVVEIHPELASLQFLTGLAYENTGHPGWAAARYRLALKYSPDMPEAREGLRRLGVVE
jgi:tetratricopeptide (TPR) repeat protein